MVWALALAGPPVVTAALVWFGGQLQRDYVFIYLGLVAVVGVIRGLWPALVAAVISFLLVDYFFVPPVGTFTIADEQDIVNLLAFLGVAGVVGVLASRRRTALIESEALATQLRQANSELVRLNKEQARAAQAALTLARTEQQIRTLQETDRLRRDLLANVSHELRTPLGTILAESTGGIQTLSDARRTMETIASEARRLNTLVEEILDMARIEGGSLELDFEPFLLNDAITAAVERLHLASPHREVEWDHAEAGREVLADWDRLGQIFDNLLANADRFSPDSAPIEVRVTSEEPELVTVRVIDHGPGVPAELRDHVFDRFVRGAPGPDGEGKSGTGLGLAIVKGLVEAHAGTVAVEPPVEGTGAVFRFTLPRAKAEP